MIEWNSRSRIAETTAPGHHTCRGDPDDDLGVVGPSDLERQGTRQLAEERPFDVHDALGVVNDIAAR